MSEITTEHMDTSEPGRILKSFFARMAAWEADNAPIGVILDNGGQLDDIKGLISQQWEKLVKIFDEYCLHNIQPERGHSFALTPEYTVDEAIKQIEVKNPDRILVYTERTNGPLIQPFIYEMRRHKGQWRIVDNRLSIRFDGSLMRHDL